MATAQKVFELAVHLMDEGDEAGKTDTVDTAEYKNRTLAILNILRGECYPHSDTYTAIPGRRPICKEIADFTEEIGLDEGICQGVLPYGLAAHLLLDENKNKATYFNDRYNELLFNAGRSIPMQSEDIVDLYGGIEHGEFGAWR